MYFICKPTMYSSSFIKLLVVGLGLRTSTEWTIAEDWRVKVMFLKELHALE